jgi:hypothetical protein
MLPPAAMPVPLPAANVVPPRHLLPPPRVIAR